LQSFEILGSQSKFLLDLNQSPQFDRV
jgi:hypothetical protein